jgi:hypothetical protein
MTLDVETLLAFHRDAFGDTRMEAAVDEDEAEKTDAEAEPVDDDEATAADKAEEEKAAAAALGDAGKQALDRMKAKWQKERAARIAAEKAAQAKPEGDDDKPDIEKIRAEAETAAAAKVNERIIRSEVRAAAAGKLHDPKDALAHLDLTQFEVDADGNVDEAEIADAIADLLEKKPYLGVTQGDEKRFKGTADAGARGKASKSQLTEADVKQLAAQGKYGEIEDARLEGRLNTLLGIT